MCYGKNQSPELVMCMGLNNTEAAIKTMKKHEFFKSMRKKQSTEYRTWIVEGKEEPGRKSWRDHCHVAVPYSSPLPEPKPSQNVVRTCISNVWSFNSVSKHLWSFRASHCTADLTCIISFGLHNDPSRWSFITILQMSKVRLTAMVSESSCQGIGLLGLEVQYLSSEPELLGMIL